MKVLFLEYQNLLLIYLDIISIYVNFIIFNGIVLYNRGNELLMNISIMGIRYLFINLYIVCFFFICFQDFLCFGEY